MCLAHCTKLFQMPYTPNQFTHLHRALERSTLPRLQVRSNFWISRRASNVDAFIELQSNIADVLPLDTEILMPYSLCN